MTRQLIFVTLFLAAAIFQLPAQPPSVSSPPAPAKIESAQKAPFEFVIVHGAWGGAWAFRDVEKRLRADGHNVHRVTLTGQGERVDAGKKMEDDFFFPFYERAKKHGFALLTLQSNHNPQTTKPGELVIALEKAATLKPEK